MQISGEEMKFDPLKFVLQLFPTRFAYHVIDPMAH